MNTFILIMVLFGSKEIAVEHIEFQTQESCEAAMNKMMETLGSERHHFSCEKK